MGNYSYAKQQPNGMKLYNVWNSMHIRCEIASHPSYKNYGAKGIKVCDEWSGQYGFVSFYNWAVKNGYEFEPDKISGRNSVTIDRINPLGNYEPLNCRWVDYKTQANNKTHKTKQNSFKTNLNIRTSEEVIKTYKKCKLYVQKCNNLRSLRMSHKLSTRVLGTKIGYSYTVVCQWEKNRRVLDDSVIAMLCKVFDCSYKELMGRTIEENYFLYASLVEQELKKGE